MADALDTGLRTHRQLRGRFPRGCRLGPLPAPVLNDHAPLLSSWLLAGHQAGLDHTALKRCPRVTEEEKASEKLDACPRLHSGTAKPVTQVCVVPGLAFLLDVFFPNESVTAPLQMWGMCRFSPNWEGRGPAGWQRLGPSVGPHQAGQHLRSGDGRNPEAPHWCWRATARAHRPAQKVLLQGFPSQLRPEGA